MRLHDGQLLKRLREGKGWSQKELANLLALSTGMVAEMELGNRQPSYAVGLRIAALFQLSMPALFTEIPLSEYAALEPTEETA